MARYKAECPQCGSKKATMNSARTIFCQKCHLTTGRTGRVERNIDHPLYETYGFRIGKTHPDFESNGMPPRTTGRRPFYYQADRVAEWPLKGKQS